MKELWHALGELLDAAEENDDTAKFREDVATLRHFWNQLGSVLRTVEKPTEEVPE